MARAIGRELYGAGAVRPGDRTCPRLVVPRRRSLRAGCAHPRRRSGHRQERPLARRPCASPRPLLPRALVSAHRVRSEALLRGLGRPPRRRRRRGLWTAFPHRNDLPSRLLCSVPRPDASPPDQRTLSSAFHGALMRARRGRSVVLAIDDAQWLDLPSARVLEFAIRRLHDVPIGIVITARSDESDPLPLGLERALPGERIHRLVGRADHAAATRDLLSAELSTRLPRSVLLEIHGTAAGNPFLALELGRAILRRGIDREPGGSLPVRPRSSTWSPTGCPGSPIPSGRCSCSRRPRPSPPPR